MKRMLFLVLLLGLVGAFAGLRMGWIAPAVPLPSFLQKRADPSPQEKPSGGRGGMRDTVTPISVALAARETVPVTLDVIGTAQALNSVLVRPQVDGRLIEIAFKEGQNVKAGDVIARIDPALYQAAYDQVMAKKNQDEALLANARRDLDRYVRLAADNTGSKQQADTQKASVAQLEAQIRADQAAIDNARTTLDYTEIRAPISGRLGLRQVDQGNLLRAGEATGIVVIAQVKPIAVIVTVAQQFIDDVNQAMANGPVDVDALGPDNATVIERGQIVVIDNQIDAATGAVKMKAVFPNERERLWPGRFVNARLFVSRLENVLTVPSSAVQRGPDGPYVYVVKDDDTVAQTPVMVKLQTEYKAVIASGLSEGQRVTTTSFSRLTDGSKVRVVARSDARSSANAAQEPESGVANSPRVEPGSKPAQDSGVESGRGRRRRGGDPLGGAQSHGEPKAGVNLPDGEQTTQRRTPAQPPASGEKP